MVMSVWHANACAVKRIPPKSGGSQWIVRAEVAQGSGRPHTTSCPPTPLSNGRRIYNAQCEIDVRDVRSGR